MDLSNHLFLDFEARSEVSIVDVGAHAYAEHPSTELLCCGWVVGMDAPVQLWLPGEPMPSEWSERAAPWVAHNKDTENCLLRRFFGIYVKNWVDTATVASAAGMPRNLHDVAESLHLPIEKLPKTALLALSKPRKITRENLFDRWWTPEQKPELYEQLYTYCKRDVDLMREALKALPPLEWVLPPRERRLEVLSDKMNEVGVEVDLRGVQLARAVTDAQTARLSAEFAELVPGINPRSPVKVAEALGIDDAKKDTVRAALQDGAEGPRARALTILKTLKTAATAKLDAFQDRTTRDGRLHGAMVFHGAGRTGRWSSMGVQLHNFIRGLGSGTPDWPAIDTSDDAQDLAFAALHAGVLADLYQNAIRTVAAMMGGFIVGPFYSGDFSQIEPRVLACWAGQVDMVEAFRARRDVYKQLASRTYGVEEEHVTSDQRFMGKRGVLGCGYEVGPDGFKRNLKADFDIDISREEAERVVYAYRQANPCVVDLWYSVDRLVKQCVLEQPQRFVCHPDVPRIAVRMLKRWLVVRLPSGRCLWYYEPELVPGDRGARILYWGRDVKHGGRWTRVDTYGGKLVENITQAIARDVMGDAMIRLDEAGFVTVLTVHDEDVALSEDGTRLDEFKSTMLKPPRWWPDLPVDVEVQLTERYTK